MTRTTPIVMNEGSTVEQVHHVPLPDGWERVWSGTMYPGDRYINHRAFALEGRVEWVAYTFADVLKHIDTGHSMEPNWYTAVIRERSSPVGLPCVRCGIRARCTDCDDCWMCCGQPPIPPGVRIAE